jgi:hypothetical protein
MKGNRRNVEYKIVNIRIEDNEKNWKIEQLLTIDYVIESVQ